MKKIYGLLFILILIINVGASETVDPPEFRYKRYYKDFTLENRFQGTFYPELERDINNIQPNTGGDAFHQFTLSEDMLEGKSESDIDRQLYQALLSFGTQQGIEYFSHRRQAYRIFIEESYVLESLENRVKKDDPKIKEEESIPSTSTFYVFQKDSSFGEGARRVDIKYDEEHHQFYLKITNEDTIKYQGLIPLADPHKFLLTLLINREGNVVNMYGITATHASTFGAIKKRISISIVYRIFALAKWFEHATGI